MILAITVLLLGGGAEVPAGTSLSVRLTSAIPAHAKPGLAVDAVLIAPVVQEGAVVLSSGATVRGAVEAARALPHERHRSYLRIAFHEVVTDAGALPLVARVSDVDNARESVDADGRIVGLGWVPVRPTKVEALLLLAAHAHPVALAALEAGKLAVRQVGRVPIEYTPGTEMTVALIEPLRILVAPPVLRPPDLSTDSDLARLATDLPTRTDVPRIQRPADLTNVLLVGTRQEVNEAFLDAGWTEAKRMGFKAGSKAFFALARRHGYKPAPVSLLELSGARPDAVFEKQNNTLAKRHHIRIWSRHETFRGRPIWLAAATHDVGIAFDHGQKTFTHRVDGRIDAEREKVAADLAFTGRVEASGLLDRPSLPGDAHTATGEPVETDGRLAVLVLRAQAAAAPTRLGVPSSDPTYTGALARGATRANAAARPAASNPNGPGRLL